MWNLDRPSDSPVGLPIPNESYRSCAISADGKFLAVAGNKHAAVIDLATLKLVHDWPLPDCRVVAFAPDSRHVVVGNANGTVYVLRLP